MSTTPKLVRKGEALRRDMPRWSECLSNFALVSMAVAEDAVLFLLSSERVAHFLVWQYSQLL